MNIVELKKVATRARISIVDSIFHSNSGHPGGSLSCIDILTVLYFNFMNVDADNLKNPDRDRFVLSKGHAAPALYAILAEKGIINKADLNTLRSTSSYLQGHPDMHTTKGVEMSTGSLGQGISAANGMAMAGKIDKKDYRVYTVLGDGELQEGEVWEAAMTASHYKLDNLTAFVDSNHLQIDGKVEDVMSPAPVDKKFEAFGWNVIKIDGHNYEAIINAVNEAKNYKGKPTVIVAETVKGKGVSFMENQASWHGSAPNKEQRDKAIEELEAYLKQLEVQ